MKISPSMLVVRCLAEKQGDQWQAFCLDFGLAAQASSFKEVKQKLDGMIGEYVYDALQGEDKEHAAVLLNRRAPLSCWVKYYWYTLLWKAGSIHRDVRQLFTETLPLTINRHYNHV